MMPMRIVAGVATFGMSIGGYKATSMIWSTDPLLAAMTAVAFVHMIIEAVHYTVYGEWLS